LLKPLLLINRKDDMSLQFLLINSNCKCYETIDASYILQKVRSFVVVLVDYELFTVSKCYKEPTYLARVEESYMVSV
jgi:hypothetical protein